MSEFSYFPGPITSTIPSKTMNLHELVQVIRSDAHKPLIEKIRFHSDKEARNDLKKKLPYCTPSGLFRRRNNDELVRLSGFCVIDLDNLPDVVSLAKNLYTDPYVAAGFTSPGGRGLKIITKIPLLTHDFGRNVVGFYDYLEKKYNLPHAALDRSTKDIARAMYISWDPHCFYNPDSKIFQILSESSKSRSEIEFKEVCRLIRAGKSQTEVFDLMKNSPKWAGEGDNYRHRTYENALKIVQLPNQDIPPTCLSILDFPEEETFLTPRNIGQGINVYLFHNPTKPVNSQPRRFKNTFYFDFWVTILIHGNFCVKPEKCLISLSLKQAFSRFCAVFKQFSSSLKTNALQRQSRYICIFRAGTCYFFFKIISERQAFRIKKMVKSQALDQQISLLKKYDLDEYIPSFKKSAKDLVQI